jgi:hypothetical protein
MDRGYIDFERLYRIHQAQGFFVTRGKSNLVFERQYSRPVDKDAGLRCDQTIKLTGEDSSEKYPEPLRRIKYIEPETGKTYVFLINNFELAPLVIADLLQEPVADRTVLQVDQTASADQGLLRHVEKRSQGADLDRHFGVRPDRSGQKEARSRDFALHFSTDSERQCF